MNNLLELNAYEMTCKPSLKMRSHSYKAITEASPYVDQIYALRNMDEGAFSTLMGSYYAAMLRTALIYLNDLCAAEDVIQETWVAVLHGLARFEGRSSLKTWIFSILINRAITRAKREGRFVSLSSWQDTEWDDYEPSVSPEHTEGVFYGQLNDPSNAWDVIPEDNLLTQETLSHIHAAIRRLPALQQRVIYMRDVEGRSATEVCQILGLSEINQRVLLHRARAKVRQILDGYLRVD
jgi:RNA polymerase sigma-70 factor, ECF subfamily